MTPRTTPNPFDRFDRTATISPEGMERLRQRMMDGVDRVRREVTEIGADIASLDRTDAQDAEQKPDQHPAELRIHSDPSEFAREENMAWLAQQSAIETTRLVNNALLACALIGVLVVFYYQTIGRQRAVLADPAAAPRIEVSR